MGACVDTCVLVRAATFVQDEHRKPLPFAFKPSLRLLVQPSGATPASTTGPTALVAAFVDAFWDAVLEHGYMPSASLRTIVTGSVEAFVRSGIVRRGGSTIPLEAQFEPTAPLSLYLHGAPGTGKSSFVRAFIPALNRAINDFLDPHMEVRFVKHNLNKPLAELKHELQLRPNNNDLSVMSIIQGRRMTFGQTKRGLVVIALEEVPPPATTEPSSTSNAVESNTLVEQGATLAHLCQRFRDIDGDATLIPILTSNYALGDAGAQALGSRTMFRTMPVAHVRGVEGQERAAYAQALLKQRLSFHRLSWCDVSFNDVVIGDGVDLGSGDSRPLVLKLRVFALQLHRAVARHHPRGLAQSEKGSGPSCPLPPLSVVYTERYDEATGCRHARLQWQQCGSDTANAGMAEEKEPHQRWVELMQWGDSVGQPSPMFFPVLELCVSMH